MTDEMPLCPDPTAHLRVVDLERALQSSRLIGAAVGILMVRQLLTYEQAFEVLRTASARLNRRVHELAAQTVETGLPPSDLTAAGNSRGETPGVGRRPRAATDVDRARPAVQEGRSTTAL